MDNEALWSSKYYIVYSVATVFHIISMVMYFVEILKLGYEQHKRKEKGP